MNKLFTKIAGIALGLAMAIGVGVTTSGGNRAAEVKAAASETATWSSGIPSFGSGYSSGSKTLNGVAWFASCAGNSTSIGWNSSTQGNNNKATDAPLSTISETTKYGLYQTSSGWEVGKIVVTISNSDSVTGTWYIWYSTDSGSTWTQANTGTLDASTTSLSYDHGSNIASSTRFAFGFGTTKTTKTRINLSNIQVYAYVTETQEISTSADSAYIDETITLTTNAASANWTITSDTAGSSLSSSSGKSTVVSATQAGSVTVQATADGYTTVSKTLTFNERPTNPYITPAKSSTSGYTGLNETIAVTYGNLDNSLDVSSSNTGVATVYIANDDGEGNANIQINFLTVGNATISLKDGSSELSTIAISVAASSVTISGLASSSSVYIGKTLDLGSTITVIATGSYSNSVTWSSSDATVASVNSSTGVVTGIKEGTANITVTSVSDPSVSSTCTMTVSEEPQEYVITFGTTKNTNPTEITNSRLLESVYTVDNAVTTSAPSKIYGISASQLKCGSGSATASLTFSIGADTYITYFKVVIATAGGTSLNVTSGASGAQIENQKITVGTLTFDDYLPSEQSSSLTMASTASGAFYISSITIGYDYRTPELYASSTSVEAAVNTDNQYVELTYANFTPTGYEAVVQSGTSLTSSAVKFDTSSTPHKATFITGEATGTTVFRITGTQGSKSAYVDITVTVTEVRNLLTLVISNASDATSFKVGETFDVGSLEVTATFDAAPTEVVYSSTNGNLGSLTMDPVIGYTFTESDIGTVTVAIKLEVGTGDETVGYDITVSDKDYAFAVTSLTDLWDGQKVYLSNGSDGAFPKYGAGNNITKVDATINNSKGLDISSTIAYAYTIGRIKIDSTTYYTFSLIDSGTTYYLKDAGNSNTNAMARTTDTTDESIYWTLTAGTNGGQWTITNKSNTTKPNLAVSGNYLSCYNGQTSPYLYAVTTYNGQTVADAFKDNYMHMDANVDGQCNEYYPIAKPVWNAMSEDERISLDSDTYARLEAWAAAKGDKLDSETLALSSLRFVSFSNDKNNSTTIIIVIITATGIIAASGYFLLRRRKEQ